MRLIRGQFGATGPRFSSDRWKKTPLREREKRWCLAGKGGTAGKGDVPVFIFYYFYILIFLYKIWGGEDSPAMYLSGRTRLFFFPQMGYFEVTLAPPSTPPPLYSKGCQHENFSQPLK